MRNMHNRLRVRDGDLCHYCGKLMVFDGQNLPDSATIEHKISVFESATRKRNNSIQNLVLACYACNQQRAKL